MSFIYSPTQPNLNLKSLNAIRFADQFAGANAGLKITAAIADLPAQGGIVDARALVGAQSISTDFLIGITVPVTILLGTATFTVSNGVTLSLRDKTQLVSQGPTQTIFKFANAGAVHGFQIGATYSSISGLSIDMQNTGTGNGILINALQWGQVRNIEVKNAGGNGIYIPSASGGQNVYNCEFSQIETHNNAGHGWWVKTTAAASGADQTSVINLETYSNGGDGFRSESFDGLTFNALTYAIVRSELNGGNGFNFVGDGAITITRAEAEGNTGWGIATSAVAGHKCQNLVVTMYDSSSNTAGDVDRSGTDGLYLLRYGSGLENSQYITIGTKDVVQVAVQKFAGQTSNLFQVNNESSTPLVAIDSGGRISGTSGQGALYLRPGVNNLTVFITGESGQSVDIFRVSDASNNPYLAVNSGGGVYLTADTPTVSAGQLGLGKTTGFGNGVIPTAITTILKVTGSGPTTPQTIVNFLKINIGGADFWVPLTQ